MTTKLRVASQQLKKNIINYGYRYMPSVEDMVKGLDYILENKDEIKRQKVSNFVRENFSIEKIGAQWLNIINKL